jgi:hypothetical protein
LITASTNLKARWDSPLVTTATFGETATTIDDTTTTAATTTSTTILALNADVVPVEKWIFNWWIVILIECLLILALLGVSILEVFFVCFKRVTHRWRNQKARSSIAASWLWTTRVLRTYGFSFSPATPLESIGKDESVNDWPEEVREPLIQLAEMCGDAAYKREVPTDEARTQAWIIAKSLKQEANRNAKWWRRVAFRFMRVLP